MMNKRQKKNPVLDSYSVLKKVQNGKLQSLYVFNCSFSLQFCEMLQKKQTVDYW